MARTRDVSGVTPRCPAQRPDQSVGVANSESDKASTGLACASSSSSETVMGRPKIRPTTAKLMDSTGPTSQAESGRQARLRTETRDRNTDRDKDTDRNRARQALGDPGYTGATRRCCAAKLVGHLLHAFAERCAFVGELLEQGGNLGLAHVRVLFFWDYRCEAPQGVGDGHGLHG